MNMRQIVKNIPIVAPVARRIYHRWINPPKPFQSGSYWKDRYESGGNSGAGSYNELAEFKAEVVNTFVCDNEITSVIEYGCGDGNQLDLAQYPRYLGFDVSPVAISICLERFSKDDKKNFMLVEAYDSETAELTLSLDVIYHLVEDSVFAGYMHRLFDSSERFVIIYSSDTDGDPESPPAKHVRHRHFSVWVEQNKSEWVLAKRIPNKYPFNSEVGGGSCADFYVYSKA